MQKNNTTRTLSNSEKLSAIVWKATQHSMSYGAFQSTLANDALQKIYHEFAEYLAEKEEEESRRLEAAAKLRKNKKVSGSRSYSRSSRKG